MAGPEFVQQNAISGRVVMEEFKGSSSTGIFCPRITIVIKTARNLTPHKSMLV